MTTPMMIVSLTMRNKRVETKVAEIILVRRTFVVEINIMMLKVSSPFSNLNLPRPPRIEAFHYMVKQSENSTFPNGGFYYRSCFP